MVLLQSLTNTDFPYHPTAMVTNLPPMCSSSCLPCHYYGYGALTHLSRLVLLPSHPQKDISQAIFPLFPESPILPFSTGSKIPYALIIPSFKYIQTHMYFASTHPSKTISLFHLSLLNYGLSSDTPHIHIYPIIHILRS